MKKQISIIGCGWLGLPLAKFLIKKGFSIKGSTTSQNKIDVLKNNGITPFLLQISPSKISGNYSEFLSDSETLIINIPPGLRHHPDKDHVSEIQHLIDAAISHKTKNVLYVTSTSVFRDDYEFPIITENTEPNADSASAQQLIKIENTLMTNANFNTTILRFGGLIDHKRHPGRYLSGKSNISNPDAPINLIHKEDCINIIAEIINKDAWNIKLNAVYPNHMNRKTYYTSYCKKHKIPLPKFNDLEKSKGKCIESSKLVWLLNYSFKEAT